MFLYAVEQDQHGVFWVVEQSTLRRGEPGRRFAFRHIDACPNSAISAKSKAEMLWRREQQAKMNPHWAMVRGPRSVSRRWRLSNDQDGRPIIPLRLYYFGGLHLPGPPVAWAAARYNLSTCQLPAGNHRIQLRWGPEEVKGAVPSGGVKADELNCCRLKQYLPFVERHQSTEEASIDLEEVVVNGTVVHVTKLNRQSQLPVLTALVVRTSEAANHPTLVPTRTYVHGPSRHALVLPVTAWSMASFVAR